jgi:hypothetical protein
LKKHSKNNIRLVEAQAGIKMPVKWTPEGEQWRRGQRPLTSVPPIEAYVAGAPEVELQPLKEEPVLITGRARTADLVPTIEHLRTDTVETTQLLIEYGGKRAWVVPSPKYTIIFETPKWVRLGTYPVRDPEKVKQYHESLQYEHQYWEIIRRVEKYHDRLGAEHSINVFYGRPPMEKSIHRSDPYLMAMEVLKLNPTRLAIQTMPRMITPRKPTPTRQLPFRLRLTKAPSYFHEHE